MRWSLALVLAGAIAAGAAGAASSAEQTQTYWLVTGNADFYWSLDYGNHPDSVFNGHYQAHLRYFITTIAVGNRGVSSRERMLVDGYGVVNNEMTVWSGGSHVPVACNGIARRETHGARKSSGSHISVSNGVINIDPGSAITWAVGCAATESNAIHGLPDGKTIGGGAPAGRMKPGVIACSDDYSHESTGDPNGHKFYGSASFSVRFLRIPAENVVGARRALRRQVGRTIHYRGGTPRGGSTDCLDTR